MIYRAIAIDPGEMTGWVTARIGEGSLTLDKVGHTPWKEFSLTYARAMIDGGDPFQVVIYESWRLRADVAKSMIGSDFTASQCIGVIKLGAWWQNAIIVTQEPMHKNVIDRQMGGTEYLPARDGVEHERDAVRHLAYYAINKEGLDRDTVARGLRQGYGSGGPVGDGRGSGRGDH